MRIKSVKQNVIDAMMGRVDAVDKRLTRLVNDKSPTIPVYDPTNLPPGIEGQVVRGALGGLYFFKDGQWYSCSCCPWTIGDPIPWTCLEYATDVGNTSDYCLHQDHFLDYDDFAEYTIATGMAATEVTITAKVRGDPCTPNQISTDLDTGFGVSILNPGGFVRNFISTLAGGQYCTDNSLGGGPMGSGEPDPGAGPAKYKAVYNRWVNLELHYTYLYRSGAGTLGSPYIYHYAAEEYLNDELVSQVTDSPVDGGNDSNLDHFKFDHITLNQPGFWWDDIGIVSDNLGSASYDFEDGLMPSWTLRQIRGYAGGYEEMTPPPYAFTIVPPPQ